MVYAYFESKERLYLAYIERAGRELLDAARVSAIAPDASTGPILRARITEFLAFVEEHGDGWRVLFREAGRRARSPSRSPSCASASRSDPPDDQAAPRWGIAAPAADAIAHALVGAGESLANWWLDHPEVGRDQVADWYLAVVQAVLAGPRGPGRAGLER